VYILIPLRTIVCPLYGLKMDPMSEYGLLVVKWIENPRDFNAQINQHPVPGVPNSIQYQHFCEYIGEKQNSFLSLMLYNEVFETDLDGAIKGMSGNMANNSVNCSVSGGQARRVLKKAQSWSQEEVSTKLFSMEKWAELLKQDLRRMLKTEGTKFAITHATPLEESIPLIVNSSKGHFYYFNRLLRAAIEFNFDDQDWRRKLLLERGLRSEEMLPPTPTFLWYSGNLYDFSTEFQPCILKLLEQHLKAYANDLVRGIYK